VDPFLDGLASSPAFFVTLPFAVMLTVNSPTTQTLTVGVIALNQAIGRSVPPGAGAGGEVVVP